MMMPPRKVLYLILMIYDLRKYKNKNKGHSLYKKMKVDTKISFRCKVLDASPIAHVFSLIQ